MQDTIRVLYVDDEPALLEIGKLFLEKTGEEFVVDTLTSATEALTRIPTEQYDAVISDYQMPDMDGIEFLRRVRSLGNTIPFILLTGRGREEVVIEAINNGVDFYLQKGGQPRAQFAELAHKVRQAVQRRRAEISLQESEERYRTVVNDLTEMICRFTQDGTVTFTNEAYRQHFHPMLALTDLEGKKIHDLMQVGNYEKVDNFLGTLTPDTPIREMELVVTGRDQKTYWQLWSVRALFDAGGKPVEYQVVGKDITEQKLALAALADSESKLRLFIETTRESVTLIDEEGKVIEWNPGAERISGITQEEALGSSLWDVTFRMLPRERRTEECRAAIEQTSRTMLRTGVPIFEKPRIVEAERPDGTRIFVRQIIFPIKTDKGFRFGSIAQDITGEKREEDAVRESEAKYRELADLLPQMVFEMDPDFQVTYANQNAFATLGYTEQDLKDGVNAMSIIEPSQHGRVKEDIRKLLNGVALESQEYTCLRKDGSKIPVFIDTAPIYRNGSLAGFRGVIIDISARKKMDAELRESEEKYRLVVENSDNVVYIYRGSQILFANRRTTEFTGYTNDELISMNIWDLVHPDDRSRLQENAKLRISGSTPPPDFTARIILKSGEERECEFFVNQILYQNQPALLGILRDVSERKRAEEAIRESEAKYRLLADHVHDVIWTADMDMRLTYVSPSVTALRGMTPEETLRESLSDALTPASYRTIMLMREKGINEMRKSGTIQKYQTMELEFFRKDGSTVWTETIISPIFDDDKKPSGVVGVMRDITERKKAEDLLRESEEKFRSIVETSPDMIWEIDLQGTFLYISPRVEAIMGYAPEEIIGGTILDLVAEEGKAYAMQELARYSSLEGSLLPLEIPARHRDGRHMVIEIRPSMAGTDGKGQGFRGVAVDITEHKKAEEALRRANRQLNLLTGITRHDILNNTSIALGFLEIAEMKVDDPALARYLKKIESAITNIQSQIEFTRIYEDIGTHEPRWIDLSTVMPWDQVPAAVSLTADVQGVGIFADPMLEKVFFSLLENAVRHGGRVTEIRVSSHRLGKDLVVVWEDNGVGIAPDEKERIFESGVGKNTGLGLFLVREILSLTRIMITETGEPGRGARFEMTIPNGGYRLVGKQ
ncbi:hybrid sensor histidine kinase/response regulator [Methanoculleus taiwanensis]|uniref:hybrid sensor histidine kinase/response regulator n=1 Tax=Methanoculleus taiwanensis TaxID=1550565 RepID=UPI000FFEBF94|nr:response regulator [Methanoculleus taiwanensis]